MGKAALVLALVAIGSRAEAGPTSRCDLKLPPNATLEEVRERTRDAVKSGLCTLAELNAIAARAANSLDDHCKRGEAGACSDLARLLLHGRSRKRDTKRALQMLEGLCAKSHGPSCHELGVVALLGWDVPQDFGRAERLLRRACRARINDACERMKQLPHSAEERSRFARARDAMKQSERDCSADPKQCVVIARKLWRGEGMEKSEEVAWRLYVVACEAGESAACALLGR